MFTAIMTFIGFLFGGILVFALLSKASRRWRELSVLKEDVTQKGHALTKSQSELDRARAEFARRESEFNGKAVTYSELQSENAIIKQDLRNIDVNLLKLQMDRDLQEESQAKIIERSTELAQQYLKETEKSVAASINANNYAACKQRLTKAIEWCREIGFDVSEERERSLLATLKSDYEDAVRAALEREEQARIKAQIREEQIREREIQRELDALQRERDAIRAALDKALADATTAHSEEVARLQARLAEAEAKSARTVSLAQMTRAGHIYVISNIGSFGELVFKIGMTRRLNPQERVLELSDASVPFPFDVHMMISSEDAPRLENLLHKEFAHHRVNKVNMRKEFFKVDLEEIRKFVVAHHGEVSYVADAEALQYRQGLTMSAEDEAYIEKVFEEAEQVVGVHEVED